MAHFARYHELDLPLFERQPVARPSGIVGSLVCAELVSQAITNGTGYILREVRMYRRSAETPLEQTLRNADTAFEQVANQCGATVLGHRYGLMPLSRTEQVGADLWQSRRVFSSTLSCVPRGHKLVAAVDIMHSPVKVPRHSTHATKIRDAIHKTQCSRGAITTLPSHAWLDASVAQFSLTVTPESTKQSLVLHDIEPIITPLEGPRTKYVCNDCLGLPW